MGLGWSVFWWLWPLWWLCYNLPSTFGLWRQKTAPCCALPSSLLPPDVLHLMYGIRSMQPCCMTLCMAHLSSGKKVRGVCSDNAARKLSQREGSFYWWSQFTTLAITQFIPAQGQCFSFERKRCSLSWGQHLCLCSIEERWGSCMSFHAVINLLLYGIQSSPWKCHGLCHRAY